MNFKNLPKENYHILGYITFFYLIAIILVTIFSYKKIDYGYYEILRWMIMAFSGWSAYKIYKENAKSIWILILIFQVILYNPVIKISLDGDIWQIINIISAIVLIIFGIKYFKKHEDT